MFLEVAFSLTAAIPRTELPSTFSGGRLFAMPRIADSLRRMTLWVDSDGSGFIRQSAVTSLRLQTVAGSARALAYLPRFDDPLPPISENHGALPILDDATVTADPIFGSVDGQLGASWLADRMWTIDYVSHHLWLDHATPSYHSADVVPLNFDRTHHFPRIDISIAGVTYRASLDTGASVALNRSAAAAVSNGPPAVVATSFLPRATLQRWHQAHPSWQYIGDAGATAGVSMILVPRVRANRVTFDNVWFSTRPNDDVFQGEEVQAKLGASAFGRCAVLLDYVHDISAFQCG